MTQETFIGGIATTPTWTIKNRKPRNVKMLPWSRDSDLQMLRCLFIRRWQGINNRNSTDEIMSYGGFGRPEVQPVIDWCWEKVPELMALMNKPRGSQTEYDIVHGRIHKAFHNNSGEPGHRRTAQAKEHPANAYTHTWNASGFYYEGLCNRRVLDVS